MPNASSRGMFAASVEYGPSFVLIACSGPATAAEICGALAFGAEIARRDGRTLFLFDLLAVDFEGTAQERQEMGRYAAAVMGTVRRLSVAVSPANLTHEAEHAARKAGLDICSFTSLPEAIEWLTA
ncbi:MAG: hypothetical protein ACAH21_17215 [Ramlibacter sp.]